MHLQRQCSPCEAQWHCLLPFPRLPRPVVRKAPPPSRTAHHGQLSGGDYASDGPRTQGLANGLDPRSPLQASLPPPGPLAAAAAASRPLAIFLSHSSVASLK